MASSEIKELVRSINSHAFVIMHFLYDCKIKVNEFSYQFISSGTGLSLSIVKKTMLKLKELNYVSISERVIRIGK